MPSDKVLVVDDDPLFLRTTGSQLESLGFEAHLVQEGAEADRLVESGQYAMVLLDLRMPDIDGNALLCRWRKLDCPPPVLMVSGKGTIPEAVEALKQGAVDFLVKPVDLNLLEAVIRRTLQADRLRQENRQLRELVRQEKVEFLGVSRAVRELLETADKIARSDHPVMLEGETGTGKQVLARHICDRSERAEEPFLQVNCAAISPTLFESELFGHERGAFTGAYARKAGKLELVGRGTLFLDEIGELPTGCQAKLLTAVEDRVFERVGGTAMLRFEGRIIAATNRNLEAAVAEGSLRKDLFYRLNTFLVKLPPLRERPEDIPVHIDHTLERCSRRYGRPFKTPGERVLAALRGYRWPGNVRELMHHVERIALLCEGPTIPERLWLMLPGAGVETPPEATDRDLKGALEGFKREHIMRVLGESGGNQSEAARRLGVNRSYLNRLLAGYRQ